VFVDEAGGTLNLDHMAERIRDDLKRSGVTRARLFTKGTNTLPFGTHAFRHSYTTRSLANGKTDDWVRRRTGHKTDELLTYRETARALEDSGLPRSSNQSLMACPNGSTAMRAHAARWPASPLRVRPAA
jgi:integrase